MPLAPWCKNEKWEFGIANGKKYAVVTGRERCPAKYHANLLWWWRNDYEQSVDEAPWFHPELPRSEREALWALRNPLQNANLFVFGVADRNYRVDVIEGINDPMVIQRDDVMVNGKPDQGYQRAKLTLDDGTVKYWSSYCGPRYTFNHGCQPSGLYEVKWNPKR